MGIRTVFACHGIGMAVITAAVLGCGSSCPMSVKVQRIALRHHHDPARLHRQRDQTTSEDYNWSGYAVTGVDGSVTSVSSSWVVPSVGACSAAPGGYSAFWAGIDGWTSNTVEQIGTDSDCVNLEGTQTGVPTYYAWFEFYPQNAFLVGNYNSKTGKCISDCVHPGDFVSAEVLSSGSGGKGPGPGHGSGGSQRFTVIISDQTQGWLFTTSSSVPGAKQSSAEWIAETPSGCNTSSSLCPLADFGTVDYGAQFTGVLSTSYATVSGQTGPIGSFGSSVQEAVMVNYPSGATTMAQPSGLEDNGTSFSVNWSNAGP